MPRADTFHARCRAVCKRCHMVMDDCEPFGTAEFFHKTKHRDGTKSLCVNAGKTFFFDDDGHSTEIEPFERKRLRRRAKRHGVGV